MLFVHMNRLHSTPTALKQIIGSCLHFDTLLVDDLSEEISAKVVNDQFESKLIQYHGDPGITCRTPVMGVSKSRGFKSQLIRTGLDRDS